MTGNCINRVTLLGALGADADVRLMPDGETRMAKISVATSRATKTRGGDWTEQTEWHRCVIWRPPDKLVELLRRGARVHLEGRLQTRSWEGPNGRKTYATEVVCSSGDVHIFARAPERDPVSGAWQRPEVDPGPAPGPGPAAAPGPERGRPYQP